VRVTDDALKAFGKAVRLGRVEADLTQQQLADAADISGNYLSGIERGQRNASLNVVYRIALALEVTASELLERADQLGYARRRQ
jgi:transcriptional regulator with XRE-family HTH domain